MECVFPGCHLKTLAKGLCTGHYQQQYYGKPLHPLTHHKTFGREDFYNLVIPIIGDHMIVEGNTRSDYEVTVNGTLIPLKRLAYRLFIGDEGDCPWMDNICGNTLCFNPSHLTPHLSIKNGGGRNDLNDPISSNAARRFWKKTVWREYGCREWTGYVTPSGYGLCIIQKKQYLTHRVAFRLVNDYIPDMPLMLDHICRNRRCVNPNHLRVATQQLNHENMAERSASNSGHRNVRYNSKSNRWEVFVGKNHVQVFGGSYQTLDEAIVAARDLRNRLHTFNAVDRIPGNKDFDLIRSA